jgi:DNA invertase Pin-like site-specific DNA recombinase
MDSKQKKVAIYARVSSQEQATEGVSIEAQVAALEAYAKSQGWEIISMSTAVIAAAPTIDRN